MELTVPKLIVGQEREVKHALRDIVRKARKGMPLDSVDWGETIAVNSLPRRVYLLLDRHPGLSFEVHVHCYAVLLGLMQVRNGVAPESSLEQSWFEWAMGEPWRFLGLLGPDGMSMRLREERRGGAELRNRKFVATTLRFWSALESIGSRFYSSLDYPGEPTRPLSMMPSNLMGTLASVVGPDAVRAANTPESVRALLDEAAQKLGLTEN